MPQIQANGITIEYESFGKESDPTILLIMGFSAQMTMWPTSFCEALAAKGFRVIRFDNRDVGKTTHLSDMGAPDLADAMGKMMSGQAVNPPYTLLDMANDAVGLLDGLGIDKAHIAGASMGGMITQLVAINFPHKTKSMISIMSTTGRRELPQATPEAMAALTTPPASDSREDRIKAGINTWKVIGSPGYPASDEELQTTVAREVDRVPYDPAGIARQMVAIFAAPPRNDALKDVAVPALVIHDADDPLIPVEGGKDTAASIPGAKLVIVPGMAHDFTQSIAQVYAKHIGEFVASVEAGEKAA